MHSLILGSVVLSVVVPGALLLAWQRQWRRQRLGPLSAGRVVVATNLVGTRRRS
jgi:uncharacterized membrane-anchored protein